jgi:hypothetical protein
VSGRDDVDMLIDSETGERLFRSARDPLSLSIRWFSFVGRKRTDTWRAVKVRHGQREIEMYVSPTGRSVRVYVDGVEVLK